MGGANTWLDGGFDNCGDGMSEELQRRIGRHDGDIEALKYRLDKMEPKIDKILDTLSQARGGWKTLLLVAGVAGSMGALAAKVAGFVKIG